MSAGFLLSMSMPINRTRGRRWLAMRAQVLQDEPRCVRCLAIGRLTAATQVDHILPLHQGGGDERSNLQPLCHDCHADKSAAERGARRKPVIGVDGWPVLRQG
jgi:5-methylcytosine-specific restriction protein A